MSVNVRRLSKMLSTSCVALIAVGAGSLSCEAQAQDDLALDEIIVTAERRESNLQQTAISITSLDGEDLRARSISSTADLALSVPSLSISPATTAARSNNAPAVFIRGIGQNDNLIAAEPGVGVYIDGVYVSRVTGSIMDLLDVERIEVLRGPQGTLFGKNTIGGAINISTRKPSDHLTVDVELLGGRFNRMEARGYISGPLSEGAKAKLALAYKKRDGHGKQLQLGTDDVVGRLGGNENFIARAGFEFRLSDSLQLDLSGDLTINRDDTIATVYEYSDQDPTQGLLALYNALVGVPSGTPVTQALLGVDGYYDNYSGRGPTSYSLAGMNQSDQDIMGLNATLTWEQSGYTIKSITAYRDLESKIGSSGDGSPLPYLGNIQELDQHQFSQELQAFGESSGGEFSWLAGLYYLNEKANEPWAGLAADGLYNALEQLPGAVIPFSPGAVCPGDLGSITPTNLCLGGMGNPLNVALDISSRYDFSQTINSYAGFAEGTYHLSDLLAVTLGLRYTYEDKELTINQAERLNSEVAYLPPGTSKGNSYDAWTPRFRLEITPNDDVLAYLSASRGFKAGGVNERLFSSGAFREFGPEFVWTYEGGFKTDLANNRVRLNGAVFQSDFKNFQATIIDTVSGAVDAYILNAGAARIRGLELETTARVSPVLDIGGTLTHLDTKITKVDPRAGLVDGQRLMKVPRWAFTLFGEAHVPLGDALEVSFRADYSHKSSFGNDPTLNPDISAKATGLVNLRAQLAAREGWRVAFFVTNATNERFIEYGLDGRPNGLGFVERKYNRPREWGVSLGYSF